ncbi:hypothetical protein DL768_006042 [Monosporascus sp. mg162]|nr:hypothetical protein DL768_006042 [Monosporascus sp. mg162]
MQESEILIVGATGQKGSATIKALAEAAQQQSAPGPRILALTRSASSEKASVFLVTAPPGDEAQAIPLIDAAVEHGVRHIVFSSVDRGGDARSWGNPTSIPHFAAKHRVELHLRDATACAVSAPGGAAATSWTILRPAGFMDNYAPGAFGKMMAGLWATMPPDRAMQLVSVRDIGRFAARVLLDPGAWAGRAVGLAGDELTFAEAEDIFRQIVGRDMPRLWTPLCRGLRWLVDDAGKSMNCFERVGFGVDIEALRREDEQVQDFESWLRTSSGWVAGSKL